MHHVDDGVPSLHWGLQVWSLTLAAWTEKGGRGCRTHKLERVLGLADDEAGLGVEEELCGGDVD